MSRGQRFRDTDHTAGSGDGAALGLEQGDAAASWPHIELSAIGEGAGAGEIPYGAPGESLLGGPVREDTCSPRADASMGMRDSLGEALLVSSKREAADGSARGWEGGPSPEKDTSPSRTEGKERSAAKEGLEGSAVKMESCVTILRLGYCGTGGERPLIPAAPVAGRPHPAFFHTERRFNGHINSRSQDLDTVGQEARDHTYQQPQRQEDCAKHFFMPGGTLKDTSNPAAWDFDTTGQGTAESPLLSKEDEGSRLDTPLTSWEISAEVSSTDEDESDHLLKGSPVSEAERATRSPWTRLLNMYCKMKRSSRYVVPPNLPTDREGYPINITVCGSSLPQPKIFKTFKSTDTVDTMHIDVRVNKINGDRDTVITPKSIDGEELIDGDTSSPLAIKVLIVFDKFWPFDGKIQIDVRCA
ncbi:hypothetical protein NDU88_005586 [Pleurodeles waltl]|uniref:Uncharacterized protein n=1 Tax=Pleurodeles waltl TaxID=8319 RepID=A0AAV7QIK3_PLEWA|nr:hypothetical protein NDU88_005586 [Pleurodeles waltl]